MSYARARLLCSRYSPLRSAPPLHTAHMVKNCTVRLIQHVHTATTQSQALLHTVASIMPSIDTGKQACKTLGSQLRATHNACTMHALLLRLNTQALQS